MLGNDELKIQEEQEDGVEKAEDLKVILFISACYMLKNLPHKAIP